MIMLGRNSLAEFLQRAFGSSLTGITSDKAMFILYGAGGDNGKSTMVEVIEMLPGELRPANASGDVPQEA